MKAQLNTTIRHASHPDEYASYTTQQLRSHFLIESLFEVNTIRITYSEYDRLIIGGACPQGTTPLPLTTFDELKSSCFLERREIGIINVGAPGVVTVDGTAYLIKNKEALYIGRGATDVSFSNTTGQSLFYFNSAPAHTSHPTRHITLDDAVTTEMGASAQANARTIRKLIIAPHVQTCQLQMGLTDLKEGSIWNTMPPHTHTRRMEAYFYFNISDNHTVCHFMGKPDETRPLWLHNHQAVISPPWSIHCGAGTSSYSFIWGMAGENLDYADMDGVSLTDLR